LASSAYSFNSDLLDGLDSEAFARVGAANTFTNTNTIQTTSANAFKIQNASSLAVLTADTSGSVLQIGSSTTDANAILLGLDSYNNGTDPTGFNGAIYYNANLNKFRCYQNGTWADCISSGASLSANNTWTGANLFSVTNANGLKVQNASAVSLFNADTSTMNVTIGSVGTASSLTLVGGTTANRPASPTEGMLYNDTTTKQLLTYANGKWQADRSEAVLVAASDSSDADKAAADYIADGDTGAAGDGDQVQINDALTAASASGTRKTGKVYLFAGTYTADATILIPNGVTLAGSGQASTIKLADIDATDNLIENSDTTTGTNITIRDLRLEGQRTLNTAGTQIGIYLLGIGKETNGNDAVNGAFISNITSYYFRTDGIRIDSSSHTTVTSSIFRDNAQYGLYILGVNSKFNSITANQSEGNNVDGFRLEQGYSNTFSGNIAYDNASAGMAIASSANSNNIVNNNFRGNNTYGIYMGASSLNNVSSNNIRGGSTYGIYISGSDGSTINDNNIYDTGSTTANNAIYLTDSDRNSINGNVVDDTSASTNNYAINVFNSTSNSNYISGNILGDNGAGVTATINDAATDTVYGGQATALNSTDILFKQTASTTAFRIQNASGVNLLNADTTNGELELGSYNGGTNPLAGKLVIANATNANTITLQTGITSSSYSLVLPTGVGTTGQCLSTTVAGSTSTLGWATCDGSGLLASNNTWMGTNLVSVTNSNALKIQNASAVSLLNVDTSAMNVTIGASGNTVTLSTTGLALAGTARPDITVTLAPEYQGATFTGDGSNNSGSLSSDFCSGSSRQNVNATICAATETHNYYTWTNTQVTLQDYDLYVRYQLPSDYDTGTMTNLKIWGWGTTSANEQVTIALVSDASGTACSTSSNAITSNTTWQQATVGSPLGACTPAAGDVVTFKVHVVASQNNYARAGEISFGYKRKF
ncbi:MAG TPA: right-handed parallel beta-helix repeat-containing protein, partial [Candidatus Saccharimonas sp.]|nr:right-handed parallel beta-helix repeat-containing protein [Candidatus Saccharimonas sp.]